MFGVKITESGDLVIRDVTWIKNMGLYKCYAHNSHGSHRTETFLYPVQLNTIALALSAVKGWLNRVSHPKLKLSFYVHSQAVASLGWVTPGAATEKPGDLLVASSALSPLFIFS